jgi:hypothetical protein
MGQDKFPVIFLFNYDAHKVTGISFIKDLKQVLRLLFTDAQALNFILDLGCILTGKYCIIHIHDTHHIIFFHKHVSFMMD